MSSLGSPSTFFLAKKEAYEVERSLMFNDDDSAYLSRTPSSAGNRKTFTYSCWFKRGVLGTQSGAFLKAGPTSGNYFKINIANDHKLYVLATISGSYTEYFKSTQLFRDTSAWYHLVLRWDTTNSTAGDRVRVYLNGTQITDHSGNNPALNLDGFVNDTNQHEIGASTVNSQYWDGYIAEVNLIDGFSYDPSYFGKTNPSTGQWNPKKYTGGYGTNGFYLNFSDNSGTTATTMGKDSSGNDNNFTPNNFVTGDSMPDSPTNNFCTMNLNDKSNDNRLTVTVGNLKVGTSHGFRTARATFGLSSGKWYWEARLITWASSFIGITDTEEYIMSTTRGGEDSNSAMIRQNNGDIRTGGSNSSYGNSQSNGDILGFALDMDNGKFYISENGTFYNSGDPVNGTNAAKTGLTATVCPSAAPYDNKSCYFNFGQDDTFDGNETSQGNTDANGLGKFKYAPPTGFLAICSANLPDPTIKLPNKHFDTVLYTGTGATLSISGLNFGPDWIWLKRRDSTHSHGLFDSVRGPNKLLYSDLTNSENQFGSLQAFNSDGFTLTTGGEGNTSSGTYAAWNWNAGDTDGKTYAVTVVSDSGNKYRFDGYGTSAVTLDLAEGGTYIFDQSDSSNAGHPLRFYTAADKTGGEYTTGVTTAGTPGSSGAYTQIVVAASAPTLFYQCSVHAGMGGQANTNSTLGSSNFDGSIQSTVKVNATAGFSIVSYTGNGTAGSTVGHGLGVKPDFMILRNRPDVTNWIVYHSKLSTDGQSFLELNTTQDGLSTSTTLYNSTAPSSSIITLGTNNASNGNNDAMIVYAFSEVSSYSKFGSYKGNGNVTGTFVFTGFRPAWIMMKESSSSSRWSIYDIKRGPINPNDKYLRAQATNAETTSINNDVDFVSNGFKMRGTGEPNASGITYVYMAFAEAPFRNTRAR